MSLIEKLVDRINEKHSSTASFYSFDPIGHSKFYLSALEWVLNEIEKLNKESEPNNGWISIDDGLPDDDKNNYLVYSIHTKVYEKVDIEKLKMMIDNSAKITHWQYLPEPPKE